MITGAVVRVSPINIDGDGTDVVSVWFQMEVLQESRMMIPDCHRRLAIAHADLLQLLVSNLTTGQDCIDETPDPFILLL